MYSPARSTRGSLNDEEGDGWLSDAVGSDFDPDEYDESDHSDEDVDEEAGGRRWGKQKRKRRGGGEEGQNPDLLYENEFFYRLVKMIRGSTAGRKLKRTIFKLSLVMMLCSFPLMVLAYIEDRTFEVGYYFTVVQKVGAALQPLMWLTGVPGFLLGAGSLIIIKYWASLCTNRKLLCNIMRVYAAVLVFYMIIVVYTVAVLFLTFGGIKRWFDTMLLARIFPFYICTCIAIVPLLAGMVFYLMDVSYFVDEIGRPDSVIEEPDPPADVMDLSDVTATQLILVTVSFPFVVFMQVLDLCVALQRAAVRFLRVQYRKRVQPLLGGRDDGQGQGQEQGTAKAKKRSGVLTRLARTIRRQVARLCLKGGKTMPSDMLPSGAQGEEEGKTMELKTAVKDRELEERLAREQAEEEAERRRAAQEREARLAEEREVARVRREAEQIAAQEARDLEDQRRVLALSRAPTLDVPSFKEKWGTLPAAGTFSCRLRALPELETLTEHMRKQGFHIVFASVPTPAEVELGICNIRKEGTEPWFLARFLSSKNTFSAVMKSESATEAPVHVKRFALAKVLKIDATSVPRSPKHSVGSSNDVGAPTDA